MSTLPAHVQEAHAAYVAACGEMERIKAEVLQPAVDSYNAATDAMSAAHEAFVRAFKAGP